MNDKLVDFRNEIDLLDAEIIQLLDKRFEVSKKVGEYKKENGITVLNSNRESEILEKINLSCNNKNNMKKVYMCIMDESKKVQK